MRGRRGLVFRGLNRSVQRLFVVLQAGTIVGLGACGEDATGPGSAVAEMALSVHSDTLWSIGARTRVALTAVDERGAPISGDALDAVWSSTNPAVATPSQASRGGWPRGARRSASKRTVSWRSSH